MLNASITNCQRYEKLWDKPPNDYVMRILTILVETVYLDDVVDYTHQGLGAPLHENEAEQPLSLEIGDPRVPMLRPIVI